MTIFIMIVYILLGLIAGYYLNKREDKE